MRQRESAAVRAPSVAWCCKRTFPAAAGRWFKRDEEVGIHREHRQEYFDHRRPRGKWRVFLRYVTARPVSLLFISHLWLTTPHRLKNTFILAGVSGHLIRFSHRCCLTNSYKTRSHSCLMTELHSKEFHCHLPHLQKTSTSNWQPAVSASSKVSSVSGFLCLWTRKWFETGGFLFKVPLIY